MKKFNLYCNGSLVECESEDDILKDVKPEVTREVLKLKVGEGHQFSLNDKSKVTWEYERVT